MQAIPAKTLPLSTITVRVPNHQYNCAAVLMLVPKATKVVFGKVPDKNGIPCFSAIFHFGTAIPPKVDKKALGIQIATHGQKADVRAGGGAAGGGRVACAPAIKVACAPTTPDVLVDHHYPLDRSQEGSMYNPVDAARGIRRVRKERGCTSDLTLAIFVSPETHLLTACITTAGDILLTDNEVYELIYGSTCLYKRMPSAHSL